ncbi:MAG TPA: hypothetical protein VK638_58010 [Edaphobacter sp.]|nr:hypothetical protein [Edaphobacter sp.]
MLGGVVDMLSHDGVEDPLVYFDGQYTGLNGLMLASSEAFLTDIYKTPRDRSIDGH